MAFGKQFPRWYPTREHSTDPVSGARANIYQRERRHTDPESGPWRSAIMVWAWTVIISGNYREGVSTTRNGARRACRNALKSL